MTWARILGVKQIVNKKSLVMISDEALKEYGSYLLSRIVVQYHRP